MARDAEPPRAATHVWDEERLKSPHAQPDKAERVRQMFDAIAPTYELVNRVASAGRDAGWRREMVRLADVRPDDVLLDVACGPGDVARAFAAGTIPPARIVGVDFAEGMLRLAVRRPVSKAVFTRGDALRLPVGDAGVSIVTCAFGIRNFQDLAAGLREMYRVLRPGGRAVILEFAVPSGAILRRLYLFYFKHILPRLAVAISRDRSGAYRYLPSSVVSFPGDEGIRSALATAGFAEVTAHRRSCGIVTLYVARKAWSDRDGRAVGATAGSCAVGGSPEAPLAPPCQRGE